MDRYWREFAISVLVIIAGCIGLIYVVVDALKDKPGALAIAIFLIVAPLIVRVIAMEIRETRTPKAPPDVIEVEPRQVTPQLPEPRWFQTSDHTFTRSDALDAKAEQIGQLLRDRRLQPTRSNIKAVGMECGVNGNEAASMVYKRFVNWNWAAPVSQGEPGRWKDELI